MPKKIIQDIVVKRSGNARPSAPPVSALRAGAPARRRGIFGGAVDAPKPPVSRRRPEAPRAPGAEREEPPRRPSPEKPVVPKAPAGMIGGPEACALKPPRRWRKTVGLFFWIFAPFAVLFAAGYAVNAFSSVLIKITPKQEFVSVDADFRASRGGAEGAFPFETMKIERSEKYSGKSSGLEKISERASGRIAVYNAYKSKPQPLVAGTRFESPGGKIYRIRKAVTVPGAEIKNGEIVPSYVEVTVYADEPGEEYNIGLVDFSIPGFKGGARYEKFYARSKTEMKGGFKGVAPVITADDIAKAEGDLKAEIKKRFEEEFGGQKPDGFLLYAGAEVFDFATPDGNPKEGDRARNFNYELKGTGTGFLIRKTDLEKELAKRYLKKEIEGAEIANLDKLKFTLLNRGEGDKNITFQIKGKARFVWRVDTNSLLEKLRSVKREEYNSVFMGYPSVDEAEMIFKPSWWRKLPENDSRVNFEQILKSE